MEWVTGWAIMEAYGRTMMAAESPQAERVCKWAYAGLVRTRADRIVLTQGSVVDEKDDADLPRWFWWAEGGPELDQDWEASDFGAWIDVDNIQAVPGASSRKGFMQAYGVKFNAADLAKRDLVVAAKPILEAAGAYLDGCWERAAKPREGYWDAWATLAWIASHDARFVAAVQLVGQDQAGRNDAALAHATWEELSKWSVARYGRTLSDAVADLRESLEAGKLTDGAAVDPVTGAVIGIERRQWLGWSLAFENAGLSLLPGLVSFRWPSELVRAAFPASALPTTTNVPLAVTPPAPAPKSRLGIGGRKIDPVWARAYAKAYQDYPDRAAAYGDEDFREWIIERHPLGEKASPANRRTISKYRRLAAAGKLEQYLSR